MLGKFGKYKSKQEAKVPGKDFKNWFWAADEGKYKGGQTAVKPVPKPADVGSGKPASVPIQDQVNQLLVDHSQVNAATFMNVLKAKGMEVVAKEAEMSTGSVAVTRAGAQDMGSMYFPYGKKKKKTIEAKHSEAAGETLGNLGRISLHCTFLESQATANPTSMTRFRVVLIQEGLGNLKDGYYYTKESLKSAVAAFEGKKMYADHPSRIDEESRPERSVRDIIGHFEGVQYLEGEDGAGRLEADVVVLPDEPFQWARALMRHALEYSKTFPDKDFIGLSINASGQAMPMPAEQFLKEMSVPDSARLKIQQAVQDGLSEIKLVNAIEDATSVDMVTEAGAKGRVLELLEGDKKMEKKEMEKKEAEEKKEGFAKPGVPEHDDGDVKGDEKKDEKAKEDECKEDESEADGEGEHDDEEQDKALFQKLLKKHLGDDSEHDEAAMKAAKHYAAAYMKQGHKKEDAMEKACEAMKCSSMVHEAMESEEAEAKKESEKKESEEKKMEAKDAKAMEAKIIKLTAENTKLREALGKVELAQHIDSALKESGLPMAATKKFKEATKVKNKADFDEKLKIFKEAFGMNNSTGQGVIGFADAILNSEKVDMKESGKAELSFTDCIND
jgi:hypothetical protein